MKRIRLVLIGVVLCSSLPLFAADPSPEADDSVKTSAPKTNPALLEWNRKTLAGHYERVGSRNPKWDPAARAALEEFAGMRANPDGSPPADGLKRLADNARQAIAANCDDPLVNYLHARYVRTTEWRDPASHAALLGEVAEALDRSQYAAIRKCYAHLRAAIMYTNAVRTDTNLCNEVAHHRHRAISNLVESVRAREAPIEEVYAAAEELLDHVRKNRKLFDDYYQPLEEPLFKNYPDQYLTYLLKGHFYLQYGWFARGTGWAQDVSSEGWKFFAERLRIADQALRRAWELNQKDTFIPAEMTEVERGLGRGRGEMEKWFARGMAINPANYDACSRKLVYLEPKWYGSEKDMLDFGRECTRSTNWSGRVHMVIIEAHRRLSEYLPKDQQQTYWQRPEVWKDIKESMDRFYGRYPGSTSGHTTFARYAFLCGQKDILREQLRLLPYTNYTALGGKEQFEKMLRTLQEDSATAKSPRSSAPIGK